MKTIWLPKMHTDPNTRLENFTAGEPL
jgi:hypothetical protein